jgi:hypothetical protein
MTGYLSFQFRVGANENDDSDRPLHKEVILVATPKAIPNWPWKEDVLELFSQFLDDVERWAQRRRS